MNYVFVAINAITYIIQIIFREFGIRNTRISNVTSFNPGSR